MDIRERVERRLAKELDLPLEVVKISPDLCQIVDECLDDAIFQTANA